MLRHGLRLPVRELGPTALQTFNAPVSEWIVQQFLLKLDALVRRGLRFDYRTVEEEVRFLRGRLVVSRQVRQPVGRQHLFQVEHQIFDANRVQNRLITSALLKVAGMTRDTSNWRLAHELQHQLAEVECSHDVTNDFRRWSHDRLMGHYGSIKPWCGLILGNRNLMSALGSLTGRSLLFPMEKVVECFVEASLCRCLPPGAAASAGASQYLGSQGARQVFQLRPDFLVEHEGSPWVIDAKWKLLDEADGANNYGLSQGDLYQLFAYGQRYLSGSGQLILMCFRVRTAFSRPWIASTCVADSGSTWCRWISSRAAYAAGASGRRDAAERRRLNGQGRRMKENDLEEVCLDWLEGLGWMRMHGEVLAAGGSESARESWSEVVLTLLLAMRPYG